MWDLFEEIFKQCQELFNNLSFPFLYSFSGDEWISCPKTSDQETLPEKRRRFNKIH